MKNIATRHGSQVKHTKEISIPQQNARLLSVNQDVRGYSRNKAHSPFICYSFRSVAVLAQTKWRHMQTFFYAYSVQKYKRCLLD